MNAQVERSGAASVAVVAPVSDDLAAPMVEALVESSPLLAKIRLGTGRSASERSNNVEFDEMGFLDEEFVSTTGDDVVAETGGATITLDA